MVIDGSLYKPGKYPVAIVLEDFETLQKMVKFHSVNVEIENLNLSKQFIIEIKGKWDSFGFIFLFVLVIPLHQIYELFKVSKGPIQRKFPFTFC